MFFLFLGFLLDELNAESAKESLQSDTMSMKHDELVESPNPSQQPLQRSDTEQVRNNIWVRNSFANETSMPSRQASCYSDCKHLQYKL